MKAFAITEGFGLDQLRPQDRPEPEPGPGEVLVGVKAVSLNYRDLLMVTGRYNPRLAMPRVPCSDAAGEVLAVGPGVDRVAVGDRVAGCFMPRWIAGELSADGARSALGGEADGVLAERVVFHAEGVVKYPEHLSFAEAATLPCAGVTAWNALTGSGVKPGDTVLIQGTGGVSLFALGFAAMMGVSPLITSGSDEKLRRAEGFGAVAGVNYRSNGDWDQWARQQTRGRGVDLVVEVGGAGTLERSLRSVRHGGHIALIGVLSGAGACNPIAAVMRGVTLRGILVGSRDIFEEMNRAIVAHEFRPVVDQEFPFGDAAAAFRHLESGSHVGKVVIRVS